ncbi:MAG: hypothetical protein H6R15_3674 [Proteobacteria bacterium]|nr:hypothetical protein [Pseudomonadota bacterium]
MNLLSLMKANRLPALPGIAPAALLRLVLRRSSDRYSIPHSAAQGNPALVQTQISKSRSSSHVQQNV